MNYFLLINLGFLFLCNALNKPNFCKDCKYFISSDTIFFPSTTEFGRCKLFPKEIEDNSYLVTGEKNEINIEYIYCSTARNSRNKCGNDGKLFENKESDDESQKGLLDLFKNMFYYTF